MKSLADVLARIAQARALASDAPSRPASSPVCPICHGIGYVMLDLPVGDPEFGKAQPCTCTLRTLAWERVVHLRQISNLGQLERFTFDQFMPEGIKLPAEKRKVLRDAFQMARDFAEDPSGWLLLHGGCGVGKTHLAAAIANRRLALQQPVMFVVTPDLLDYLRAAFSPQSDVTFDERFEQVRNAPLLILDDLGAHSATSWAEEKLYQIINHRYNARLPTVVTTNHRLEDLDERIVSRLADSLLSRVVHITAPDFRQGDKELDKMELSTLHLHSDERFDTFDLTGHALNGDQRASLRAAFYAAQEYAQSPENWLVFTGGEHCGKTHLAAAIANERRTRFSAAPMFVFTPDLLDYLRAAFNPTSTMPLDERFDRVKKADLLVLDDLGAQGSTIWADEKLFQLVNYRYVARLPTVATVRAENYPLEGRFHARVFDPGRSQHIKIEAPAYRPVLRDQPPSKMPASSRRRH